MGSSKTKTSSSNSLANWQTQPLQSAFSDAQNLYNQQQSETQNSGLTQDDYNTYSPLNPTEQTGLSNAASGGQLESSLGTLLSGLGSSGTSALSGLLGSLSSGASGNYNQGTTTAGTDAINGTGGNAATSTSALNSALTGYNTDPTQSNINNATSYMNNSQTQNMIDAATKASNLNYAETTTPQLNADAVAGGNLNSSRAGAAQAISDANQSANNETTATNILNNAYNTGLSTSESAREANLQGLLGTASGAQSGASLSLAGQMANNDQTNANNTTKLNYLQQLQDAANSANSTAASGATLATTGGNDTYNAGAVNQQNAEDAKTGATTGLSNYLTAQDTPLQNLWSIISNAQQQWGGSSTSTSSTTPSIGQSVLSALGGASSLATSLLGKNPLSSVMTLGKKTS